MRKGHSVKTDNGLYHHRLQARKNVHPIVRWAICVVCGFFATTRKQKTTLTSIYYVRPEGFEPPAY